MSIESMPEPAAVKDRLVQVIVLVDDLAAARRRFENAGFRVFDGGRHPGRGTANLIVPFGDQYLELLAVVDEDEAHASHARSWAAVPAKTVR
jgi:Glyoxalase-like domain